MAELFISGENRLNGYYVDRNFNKEGFAAVDISMAQAILKMIESGIMSDEISELVANWIVKDK